MDLIELGDLLREERERQGLTLDDVAEKSKISRRNLTALEEGNAASLPHPVYAKGFVKSYSQILGLDSTALANVLASNYLSDPSESVLGHVQQGSEISSPRAEESKKRRPVLSLLVVAGLLTVLVGLVLSVDFTPLVTQGPATKDVAEFEPSPSPAETSKGSGDIKTGKDGAAEKESVPLSEGVQPKKLAQTSEAYASASEGDQQPLMEQSALEQMPPAEIEATVPEPQENVSGIQVLRIAARAPCWLRYSVDGGGSQDLYLRPDEEIELEYEQDLSVRLGNAGGVSLFLDGEPYPLEAGSGEVAVLSLP